MSHTDVLSRVLEDFKAQGIDYINEGDVRPMEANSESPVADNPEKFWVAGKNDFSGGVLFVSNEVNPNMIARAVERAEEARTGLSVKGGSVILIPVCSGVVNGRSYAFWPRERVLSTNRLKRYIQRRVLTPDVIDWTLRLAEDTSTLLESESCEEFVVSPLKAMANDERFGGVIAEDCERALERLHSGVWAPMTVLAHNDLWMDNVLLRSRPVPASSESYPFVIIDWAGSKSDGYPFYDLTRFMISAGIGTRATKQYIQMYSQILKCDPVDGLGYILASLGDLGHHLEQFPEERYVVLVMQCHRYLKEAIR